MSVSYTYRQLRPGRYQPGNKRFHAVMYGSRGALCGAQPDAKGWGADAKEPTCPKCIRLVESIGS